MRDSDQRAQFVRGVMRRTGSAAAPEWAPGSLARLSGFLAVWLLALAATLVYRVFAIVLSGKPLPATVTDVLVAAGIAWVLCFVFWRLGRIALASGFSFPRMVMGGALFAPCLAFFVRAIQPGATGKGWLILGAIVLFSIGMLPTILRIVQGLTRRRRGYDEGHAHWRSLPLMVFECILLIGGLFTGAAWFDVLIRSSS
ncbi:MAG TPA: hypothetical protein PK297_08330 [Spirochaetota bacterium]|nr:hypothetical protein [Spirochaetota bacterium]